MTRRHVSVLVPGLVLGLALLVSACGSSRPRMPMTPASPSVPDATSRLVAPTSSAPAGQGGSIGDAIKVTAEAPGQANDAACATDARHSTTAPRCTSR